MRKTEKSWVKGAAILAAAGIFVRLIGILFRIPISNLVGSYGNGIFSNVFSIYSLLLMVSTVGFPVAVSKMISENVAIGDFRAVTNVFKVSLLTLFVLGGLSSLFLFFGASWLIGVTNWPSESIYAIQGIAFSPLIVAVCSVYRGYFQGFQNMLPTAISQVIEQVVRIVLGVFLCWYCVVMLQNVSLGVGGAYLGTTISSLAACLLLIVWHFYFTRKHKTLLLKTSRKTPLSRKRILKRLVLIAVPVTLTSAMITFFSFADAMMYVDRLALAGFDSYTATALMGDFSYADTFVNIPLSISATFAAAMIPAISESFALKDQAGINERINTAIRLVVLVALPCCIGLSVLSDGIFMLIFPGSEHGAAIMEVYAFATIFIMLSNTFQSILQSIDRFIIPLIALLGASVVRIGCSYVFMAIPALNIYGVVLSTMLTFIFLMIVNFLFIRRYTRVRLSYTSTLVKPFIASAIMGMSALGCYNFLLPHTGNTVSVLAAIAVAAVIYFFLIIFFGILSEDELELLPGKRLLLPLMKKIQKLAPLKTVDN
ncbi:putative polysaccharide biosynthesis protein [Eubacterium limosum]|uniref:putative polysaccharide biosynthesis protein n=1 Tax=Eubacterium limosum TaxID=1736 RepID=UPI001062DE0B|nr:polysaccharide biosynthesis protein [Eubacterium limosum]